MEGDSGSRTTSSSNQDRSPIVRIQRASRIYQMGEVRVTALQEATLHLRHGELLVILGPSGSGKTTLLNLLGGMDRATSGQVIFGEIDLATASDRELTRFRRESVGFVFQFYNLVPGLTAIENVQVATEVAVAPLAPMEALNLVGLEDRADHFPSQLSGGEQQRVSIARALAKRPRLMLCDEPTGALDIETGKHVLGLLIRLKEDLGLTIALITHNHSIAGIGDRVAVLKDGVVESVTENACPLLPEEVEW